MSKNVIRHCDGTRDSRYTIRREFCGKPERYYVVRFCGVWLGSFASQFDALAVARHHQEERQRALAS